MAADYTLPAVTEKRTRFFDGQFLTDQDFIDEQKYHLDRHRRHQRLLHVSGICEGLEVTAAGPNAASVAPGTAVDADGRGLALAAAVTVDLPAATFNDQAGVRVYLAYQETPTDQQTSRGIADDTRWLERPVVVRLLAGAAWTGTTPPVLLAELALDNKGEVRVDPGPRQYAGIRLAGPGTEPPTLRTLQSGVAALGGSLSVSGHLGVGTAAPENVEGWQRVLDVLGGVSTKLSVRTTTIDGRVLAHNGGWWGSTPGMVVGTRTNHPLALGTNGATRVTVTASGRVGILTDPRQEPAQELSVGGRVHVDKGVIQSGPGAVTGTADLGLYSQAGSQPLRLVTTGGPIRLFTDGGAGTTARLTVEADGDVGIGIDPTARLDVAGVGDRAGQPALLLRAGNSASRFDAVQLALGYNGTAQYRHTIRTRHNGGAGPGNALDFYVWTPGDPNGLGFTHTLTMDGGHVGVGTTTPENADGWARVLDVLGDKTAKLSVRTTAIDARVLTHDSGWWGSLPGMVVGTKARYAVSLATNATTRLTVTEAGQVGIGTTAPENADGWSRVLDVVGEKSTKLSVRTTAVDARVQANDGAWWGAPVGMTVGTKSAHPLSLATNAATRLTVTSTGDIGIGTTTPENAENWTRVVDVLGEKSTKLSVRTGTVDARVQANDAVSWGAPVGMTVGTKSAHPLSLATNAATRLTVTSTGDIGIGTTTPENAESWARVVDVMSRWNIKLSLRTERAEGRVLVHDDGFWGPAGMVVGTKTNHALTLATNATGRLTIGSNGNIGIGAGPEEHNSLTVSAEQGHLHLRRKRTETTGGERTFIELFQEPNDAKLPETRPHILFHHGNRFWWRIEAATDGFRLKHGPSGAGYANLTVKDLFAGGQLYFHPASNWGGEGAGVEAKRYWFMYRHNWNWNNYGEGSVTVRPTGFTFPDPAPPGSPLASDERFKHDIRVLPGALDRVRRLRGVTFTWSELGKRYLTADVERVISAGPDATEEEHEEVRDEVRAQRAAGLTGPNIGLVAQEVEAVAPELVSTDVGGWKTLDYARLTAVLVEAIKEQQETIERLAGRLDALTAGKET